MKQIRSSKFSKFVAYYLAIMMFLQITQPMQMYALTSGPIQPEFNAFTPIGTSDMVDLASGDFNYNIPIMDVGGYPINLAYNSGVTMDQEASWVGLGWNLNVGQIERQVRGLPDDFKGDLMHYENDLRDNVTIGTHFGLNAALSGFDAINLGLGLGVQWNNYEGITFKPSYGIGFELCDNVSVGLDFSSSVGEGASVSPSVSISGKVTEKSTSAISSEGLKGGGTIGLGFNSRKGVENLNLSITAQPYTNLNFNFMGANINKDFDGKKGGLGGTISFNSNNYTPSKRIGFTSGNFSFNGSFGGEVYLAELQGHITGYGSYQSIDNAYKDRYEKAYGYENTQYKQQQNIWGSGGGVLDFNRENERTVTENTTVLPITNYTYDTYSISGQGVSGMFRPYRSQVSYVYNDKVTDNGFGATTGVEIGAGNAVHWGGQFTVNPSQSHTGGWFGNNNVLPYFTERNTDNNNILYEPTTFKLVGGLVIDSDNIYSDKIVENKAMNIKIGGMRKNRWTEPFYMYNNNFNSKPITSKIKKTKRFLRNQLIQKISAKESQGDAFVTRNVNANDHHTAGIKVLQTDGSTYVYGNAAYNIKKVEATYDVSALNGNLASGLVSYNGSLRGKNNSVSDKYVNRITTPKYAHSYLISSVLSSDYEDVDGNGPSLNDLGSYTQFTYKTMPNIYSWRIPFDANTANFNNGLFSNPNDEKASYLYGQKELKYLDKIITKTHVAFFDLEDRKDAIGTRNDSENGGAGSGRLKKIKSIRLYSRPEVTINGQIVDPIEEGLNVEPIKKAHFIYSYNLCGGNKLSNKLPLNSQLTENELSYNGGKLTLEKVYFTYRNSNMGKYTPYVFYYGKEKAQGIGSDYSIVNDSENNPNYDNKGFDIWGNYKPNDPTSGNSPYASSPLSTSEYPFVEQDKPLADQYTGAWTLKNISLPSGGLITIETESDDYQYVQDKKAMQMFKVVGAGNANSNSYSNSLYNGNDHIEYIYVQAKEVYATNEGQKFIDKYLKENYNKYIYFRFLLNMTANAGQKEFVSGYFQIDNNPNLGIKTNGTNIVGIPVKKLKRDGGTNGNAPVNPISKTGWGFGRTYLNREVYSLGGATTNTDFKSIVNDLVGSIQSISELVTGPNKALQDNGCARIFNPEKSWIRLENPDGFKLGGGLRVKSIKLSDEWNSMLDENGGTSLENMEYGQEYTYEINGKSSGVATYEPNASSENALIEPFFPAGGSYAEKIASPRENNYVEKPFGEGFFPSSKVTYSSVTVKNLKRENQTEGLKVGKHATGKVVTNFYTSRDFPTKVKWTNLTGDNVKNDVPSDLGSLFASIVEIIDITSHLTMTQGFSIETNDMDGKMKSQEVYPEGVDDSPISKVEYFYNVDNEDITSLDNNMLVINSKGEVENRLIGLDYDVINDFNESYSEATVAGMGGNVGMFLAAIFPVIVPIMIPKKSSHKNLLRTAVTTKHVHKTGILVEKVATDLGSTVSTKNLLWDAESGQVLLTQTINEYNDKYYSFSYPAYWMYDGMGLASTNIGIEGVLKSFSGIHPPTSSPDATNNPYFYIQGISGDISKYFHVGDELYSEINTTGPGGEIGPEIGEEFTSGSRMWVVGFNALKTGVLLMDRNGNYINKCEDYDTLKFKVVRSGYRNLQSASMASVTSMINPLKDLNNDGNLIFDFDAFLFDGNSFNPRIINASAVVYKDFWRPQYEVKYYPEYGDQSGDDGTNSRPPGSGGGNGNSPVTQEGLPNYPFGPLINPYVWNVKGDWRAQKSYAYLTGRNNGDATINNPRNEGFYTKFNSFYQLDENKKWFIDETDWTYASSITQFSPYGPEIENKDALNRYSSAQYAYKYTLPIAVASNAKYRNMGFEGFESDNPHFPFLADINAISEEHSHTGKKSIKIINGQSWELSSSLLPVADAISELNDCPIENDNGGGGNNLCNTYYSITNNIQSSRAIFDFQNLSVLNAYFTTNGNSPNSGVNLTFTNDEVSILYDHCNPNVDGGYVFRVVLENNIKIEISFSITPMGANNVTCIDDNNNGILTTGHGVHSATTCYFFN